MTETTDEWTIRSEEEWVEMLYYEWESDWFYVEANECTTKAICLHCGNALIPSTDRSLFLKKNRCRPQKVAIRMICEVCP